MENSYTAQKAASLLLEGTGLSEWEIGFLAIILHEVAEWHERNGKMVCIACNDCLDELTQMNSQHRGSIEPVFHALTALCFSVSCHSVNGERAFVIENQERRDQLPGADVDALHGECGWGSNAHRQALRGVFHTHQITRPITSCGQVSGLG